MIKISKNKDKKPEYLNYSLSIEKRVDDLVDRLTLEEKISQIFNISTEIERLNIPHYDWRNEALQGVAFVDKSTIFPQVIGMAATFNDQLIQEVANIIGIEARARYHEFIKRGIRDRWTGITFSTPNINIVRDPRWGRAQETFGEDPYLTSRMGIAFCKGLQGNHPDYLQTCAEPKHYTVHSGPERYRHEINIDVSEKDLYETYLPAFKACIQEGHPQGIMSAYNRVNGEPASGSSRLLQKILRDEFGFTGYVISDGGAVRDIYKYHKLVKDYSEAAAMALKNGCDILNPFEMATRAKLKRLRRSVLKAFNNGLIDEETIDRALRRALTARFRLGMFDPPELVPYTNISFDVINSTEHRKLALQTARESIVLLKNQNNLLPLGNNINSIAIIGPIADDPKSLYYTHYYTNPPKIVTILEGLKKKISSNIRLSSAKGCHLREKADDWSKALKIAKESDVIIGTFGLNSTLEGEEGYVFNEMMGDRENLRLPEIQEKLLAKLSQTGTPMILVLTSGSAIAINHVKKTIPSILHVWYPGCEGGNAVADVLFGSHNPSGRLPITFYKSVGQLPDYHNYSMENRTYRYLKEKPLFPFGYGLSYSEFEYSNLRFNKEKVHVGGKLSIQLDIKNLGPLSGYEVVQLYIKRNDAPYQVPNLELKDFSKHFIEKGQQESVSFTLLAEQFETINNKGQSKLEPGEAEIYISSCQPRFDNKRYLSKKIQID
ncbi:MAG: glycoside hydrolase family 3 protein [Promethearchaeota archaeon]|nr:MAG: glycoside hydrolase family 3 protein [Candidatus Lokiarchaeota archaeon]